jgi:hypothetical protein
LGTAITAIPAASRFEKYFEVLAQEIEKHWGQRPDPAMIAEYDSELVT